MAVEAVRLQRHVAVVDRCERATCDDRLPVGAMKFLATACASAENLVSLQVCVPRSVCARCMCAYACWHVVRVRVGRETQIE